MTSGDGSAEKANDGLSAPATAAAALVFDGVSVRYRHGTELALRDCSFSLDAGSRTALVGSNGSGKTTILLTAVGLLQHQGSVRVDGLPVSASNLRLIRNGIGCLFANPEDQILFSRVLDDVAFTLVARGVAPHEAREEARSALQRLGIPELADRSPYQMSHGQRLRAALAGALVSRPPLLLLDEPTSGLDRAGRLLLAADLRELPSAMLIATHDRELASSCCERYLKVEDGRVVEEGTDFSAVEM
ncbi:ABC transporter ATP-binding protein [soil metagenome]